jgi:SAM-dependent methyltransferase
MINPETFSLGNKEERRQPENIFLEVGVGNNPVLEEYSIYVENPQGVFSNLLPEDQRNLPRRYFHLDYAVKPASQSIRRVEQFADYLKYYLNQIKKIKTFGNSVPDGDGDYRFLEVPEIPDGLHQELTKIIEEIVASINLDSRSDFVCYIEKELDPYNQDKPWITELLQAADYENLDRKLTDNEQADLNRYNMWKEIYAIDQIIQSVTDQSDIFGRLAKLADREVPDHFVSASAARLPFKDESVDFVLAKDVIGEGTFSPLFMPHPSEFQKIFDQFEDNERIAAYKDILEMAYQKIYFFQESARVLKTDGRLVLVETASPENYAKNLKYVVELIHYFVTNFAISNEPGKDLDRETTGNNEVDRLLHEMIIFLDRFAEDFEKETKQPDSDLRLIIEERIKQSEEWIIKSKKDLNKAKDRLQDMLKQNRHYRVKLKRIINEMRRNNPHLVSVSDMVDYMRKYKPEDSSEFSKIKDRKDFYDVLWDVVCFQKNIKQARNERKQAIELLNKEKVSIDDLKNFFGLFANREIFDALLKIQGKISGFNEVQVYSGQKAQNLARQSGLSLEGMAKGTSGFVFGFGADDEDPYGRLLYYLKMAVLSKSAPKE